LAKQVKHEQQQLFITIAGGSPSWRQTLYCWLTTLKNLAAENFDQLSVKLWQLLGPDWKKKNFEICKDIFQAHLPAYGGESASFYN
jgi:hypothetical protein